MLTLSKGLEIQVQNALEKAFPEAAAQALDSGSKLNPQLVRASKPEFGDFQINGALQLSKQLKTAPREIAEKIIQELNRNERFLTICNSAVIAGPGFINLTLQPECLTSEIKTRVKDPRIGVPKRNFIDTHTKYSRVVVDFSSPNIAKEMHVGHLRSTIIGDSLARILEFRGYEVLRINHIGDWGTQFGMLITHLKTVAPEALTKANALELENLVEFYKQAKQKFDSDEIFQKQSREEVVRLQAGDSLSIKAWSLLCDQSRREFQQIYNLLDIQIHERGESFYNKYLANVITELTDANLLIVDQGAKCIFLDEKKNKGSKKSVIIIQKSDGGFNYATTDLAALRYRFNQVPEGDGASRIIYVTDAGQANHFEGIFEIAKRANWIPKGGRIEHVPFGLVQGPDGKKLKTRSGETIRLRDLLDEAVNRAEVDLKLRLQKEGREESEEFIKNVSTTVGIAAVKYADLSQNRITNYQFSFDRMLALQGNTAPYLLYALVRISGIARRGGSDDLNIENLEFNEPQEWELIRELLKFDEIIVEVEEELLPNRLCTYLFELSQIFNRFYEQVPILKADMQNRISRLTLCRLTAKTLQLGMNLLGIPSLERM